MWVTSKHQRTDKFNNKYLIKKAKLLNKKKIPSEVWFKDLWIKNGMKHRCDRFNRPTFPFIADLRNRKLRYIVEVDGSYHDRADQIEKDKFKDDFYKKNLYRVFRVKAYDIESFNAAMSEIKKIQNI